PDGPADLRATALWGACWLAFHQDDLVAARRYSEQLLRVTSDDETSLRRRNALTAQAMLRMAEGDFTAALIPLERSAAITDRGEVSWYMATSKLNLALDLLHLGRLDRASSLLAEARELYARLGDRRFEARVYAYQGHLELLRGEIQRASDLFCRSAHRFDELGDQSGVAEALEGLSAVAAAGGAMDRAAVLLGAARHARERSMSKILPFERALIERWLDEAQQHLGEKRWSDLLEQGSATDVHVVLDMPRRNQ
ncbi:MAG: hypothetical protein M3290_13680, partial [Actinomycetota bacterium]|nr:hypothetical protein [Actinomycetota bacterium]